MPELARMEPMPDRYRPDYGLGLAYFVACLQGRLVHLWRQFIK